MAPPADTDSPWPELRQALPDARLQGQADFRFLGLRVYRIALWSARASDSAEPAAPPLALVLTYARALDGKRIAERSLAEMRGIAPVTEAQAERWLAGMTAAFPDVQTGERLTGVWTAAGTRFFHQGRPRPGIDDPRFGELFFGIWLSPRTSAPSLRAQLLKARG